MAFAKFYQYIEIVLYIASNSGAFPVISKNICEYLDVKPRHLEPVMQVLVKGGILKGTKGPKGGYTLAKEKRKITLWEVYILLKPENAVKKFNERYISSSVIADLSNDIDNVLFEKLNAITIEDLCNNLDDSKNANGITEEFNI